MKHTIVETAAYLKQAERIGLTGEDRAAIKAYLADNPEAGDIIRGSGGVRKVRFAIGNKGKSGGIRLFTFYWSVEFPVYVLTAITKSKQANLTDAQVALLARIVKEIKDGQ